MTGAERSFRIPIADAGHSIGQGTKNFALVPSKCGPVKPEPILAHASQHTRTCHGFILFGVTFWEIICNACLCQENCGKSAKSNWSRASDHVKFNQVN